MSISARSKEISSKETISSRKKAVKRVIETVNEKLDEPLTMNEMAKIAYMSPFHFNRVFHQVTGLPPVQFLYAMRLELAKRLLLTTDKSVTEICFEVGYNSLGTFTTRFTELVGLSPKKYRRLGIKIYTFDWMQFYAEGKKLQKKKKTKPVLKGIIQAPENFEGLIFIGLFEQMIPQSIPVVGTVLTQGGEFYLDSLPNGDFYLLVAAFPRVDDPYEYLLPDFSKLLVGISEDVLNIKNEQTIISKPIDLRHLKITDPPILLALPNLLANEIANFSSLQRSKEQKF